MQINPKVQKWIAHLKVRKSAIWQRSLLQNMDSPNNRDAKLVLEENKDAVQLRDEYTFHDLFVKATN